MNSEIELSAVITDIAAGPFGSNLKVSCFVPVGFPIIDGANLKGLKVTDNLTKFVTEEKARSLSRSIARRGDIVVTISGTLGQIAYIPDDSLFEEYLCSQRQFKVTFNTSKVYVPYLVFYFHTREGQSKILAFANQTGVPALAQPTKNFKKIRLSLPPLEQQRKIALIAELLTSKIEANTKLNGYLAEQCEGIAEHQTGDVVALASLCGLVSERVDCREADIATYVSTESLLPAKMGKQTASSLPQTGKVTVYKAGDTLVSNIRPYFKKIWYADRAGTCSGDVLVFRANQSEHAGYLYSCLRQDRFFDYVMKGAKGTKMPRGDKKQMLTYEIVNSPSAAAIGAIQTALEQISIANKENDSLAALRDALLPKLMSGEIDVSEVDLTQLNSHLSKCSSGSCYILPVMAALSATKWRISTKQSMMRTLASIAVSLRNTVDSVETPCSVNTRDI